ncbi:MAG TPA: hypothetical protein PLC89_12535 [Haliscomenobacter sp.]|uniref:hypothetical protein n=1 Tax=Haliscomenobacter sp. TaxID=2717303 RepID=UPI002D0CC8FE|nr:hypothetical protein [Haliscomenobacter sp.]HOY18124.1 hypothetical protein [Haliscomenobacter sp.]HPH19833.1 hypothetical protein [Haliscomenobacter sp.]
MIKKFAFSLMVLAALTACKNDKNVKDEVQDELSTEQAAPPAAPKEEAYQKATQVQELLGTYVTSNYPDKGIWKKVTMSYVAGDKVLVEITGNPLEDGRPSCAMRDIGTFKNGRIEIPIEKKEDMPDADRTLMLLQLKDKDNIALRSKGTREQYWIVLSLFCNVSTTLADNYRRIAE